MHTVTEFISNLCTQRFLFWLARVIDNVRGACHVTRQDVGGSWRGVGELKNILNFCTVSLLSNWLWKIQCDQQNVCVVIQVLSRVAVVNILQGSPVSEDQLHFQGIFSKSQLFRRSSLLTTRECVRNENKSLFLGAQNGQSNWISASQNTLLPLQISHTASPMRLWKRRTLVHLVERKFRRTRSPIFQIIKKVKRTMKTKVMCVILTDNHLSFVVANVLVPTHFVVTENKVRFWLLAILVSKTRLVFLRFCVVLLETTTKFVRWKLTQERKERNVVCLKNVCCSARGLNGRVSFAVVERRASALQVFLGIRVLSIFLRCRHATSHEEDSWIHGPKSQNKLFGSSHQTQPWLVRWDNNQCTDISEIHELEVSDLPKSTRRVSVKSVLLLLPFGWDPLCWILWSPVESWAFVGWAVPSHRLVATWWLRVEGGLVCKFRAMSPS